MHRRLAVACRRLGYSAAARDGAFRLRVHAPYVYCLLAMVSLTTYSLAFPQVVRLITGLSPKDPRFRIERTRFLRWIGAALRPGSGSESGRSVKATAAGERQVA